MRSDFEKLGGSLQYSKFRRQFCLVPAGDIKIQNFFGKLSLEAQYLSVHHLVFSKLDTSVTCYCENEILFIRACSSPHIRRAKWGLSCRAFMASHENPYSFCLSCTAEGVYHSVHAAFLCCSTSRGTAHTELSSLHRGRCSSQAGRGHFQACSGQFPLPAFTRSGAGSCSSYLQKLCPSACILRKSQTASFKDFIQIGI